MKTHVLLYILCCAATTLAARMTITSYGIPRYYPLAHNSAITFDANGLFATVTTPGAPDPDIQTYYLGYSNIVRIDTIGGALDTLIVNDIDGKAELIDFHAIDYLEFIPAADNTKDYDDDGLTDFEELMFYSTNPRDPDTDGDGIPDDVEVNNFNKSFHPLVADIPAVSTRMLSYPQIYLNMSLNTTTTRSVEWTTEEAFSEEQAYSETWGNQNSIEVATGVSVSIGMETGLTDGFKVTSSVEFNTSFTYGHVWTHEVNYETRKSHEQTWGKAVSESEERGETIDGGKLSVMLRVKNSGLIAFTMGQPRFMLYSGRFVDGRYTEDAVCELLEKNSATHEYLLNTESDLELNADLTLAEVEKIRAAQFLKVRLQNSNMSYTPPAQGASSLTFGTVQTSMAGKTARISIDFDDLLKGQESPLTRNVATVTKWNPGKIGTPEQFSPVYLGEMLKSMGVTYSFDSLGFRAIQGLSRDANNVWVVHRIHVNSAGGAADTVELRIGRFAGPDSLAVSSRDIVLISYSGDDDRDSVPNAVEKMKGTFDKPGRDFDGDGLSDFQEVYGWIPAGSTTKICTNPASKDTDNDGIDDKTDPDPLYPRQMSASNLKQFTLLRGPTVIDSLSDVAFVNDTGALVKPIPALPRFTVDLDSMPLWCKVQVGPADIRFLDYETTLYDTNTTTAVISARHRFRDTAPSVEAMLALGDAVITITTKPMDKGAEQQWVVKGKSAIDNLLSAPVAANQPPEQTQAGAGQWEKIDLRLSGMSAQLAADPRTKGMVVFRSTSASAALNLSAVAVEINPANKYGEWAVDTIIAVMPSQDVTYRSSGLRSGTTYYYRAVPFSYTADKSRYFYTDPTGPGSAATWKIGVKVQYHNMYVNDEGDGAGNAEFWQRLWVKRNATGATEEVLNAFEQHDAEGAWSAGGTNTLNWIDSHYYNVDDSLHSYIKVLEDDGGAYDETFDDVLFDGALFSTRIRRLVTGTTPETLGDGIGFKNDTRTWDLGGIPPAVPKSTAVNRVKYVAARSAGDGSTTITITCYISWWFEP
jgi:hypothetical protein